MTGMQSLYLVRERDEGVFVCIRAFVCVFVCGYMCAIE
jgi:hypothetical protein